jgi:DNA-binding SARP family transcriptional activator
MNLPPDIRVSLLDGFTVRLGGAGPPPDVGQLPRGVQRLVASLCLAGRPARTAIAGQLWPDLPEDHAQGSLRSALWRLQKSAPGLVECSGGALSLASAVQVDVREFREWARRVLDPRTDVGTLPSPLDWFPGELLPGWYDDWVLFERERLHQLRLHALEAASAVLLRMGLLPDALQAALEAVRGEPLRETSNAVLISVYLAEGNVVDALRQYDVFRALLDRELGVAPSPRLERLLQPARPLALR